VKSATRRLDSLTQPRVPSADGAVMTTIPRPTNELRNSAGLLTQSFQSQNPSMASQSDTQDLLEKIRSLPDDKIAEVVDFVDFLRARIGSAEGNRRARLQAAYDAGALIPPKPGAIRTSTTELPPAVIPGQPASEMVIEDRR
jgi:hypothetical protein